MNAPSGLVAQMSRIVHRFASQLEVGREWSHDAASFITTLPAFQDLLIAAQAVDELDRLHVERRWGTGSTGVNCAACGGPFPCATRRTLDRRQA